VVEDKHLAFGVTLLG